MCWLFESFSLFNESVCVCGGELFTCSVAYGLSRQPQGYPFALFSCLPQVAPYLLTGPEFLSGPLARAEYLPGPLAWDQYLIASVSLLPESSPELL